MSSPHRRPTGPTPLGAALRRTGIRLVAALAGATVVIVVAMATLPQLTNNNHDVRGASVGPDGPRGAPASPATTAGPGRRRRT